MSEPRRGPAHLTTVAGLRTTATSIAAHAAEWQTSGANTFLYVNTSNRSETLSSANMKIELQGAIALTSGNISHA